MVKHGPVYNGQKNWLVLITAILLVIVPTVGGLGFEMAISGGATNGQYHATAASGIGKTIQAAYGWDNAKSTYVTGQISQQYSNNVTISFTAGDAISFVWIFTNNTTWDANALLSNATVYNQMNVKIAASSQTNLTGAAFYMGVAVNSSALTAQGDKGVTNFLVDQTIYSSTVNKLNQVVELPVLQLLGSKATSTGIMYLGLSQGSGFNKTGSVVSIVLTQEFGHTQQYNILTGTEAFMLVLALVEILLVYIVIPRHKEWEA